MGASDARWSSRAVGRTMATAVAASVALGLAGPAHAAPGDFTTSEVFGGFTPSAVAAADFDGRDGIDLAIANEGENGVSILFNRGDGTFTPAPTNPPIAVGEVPSALVAAHLDAGESLDLAVANNGSDDVTVLLNDGSGKFTAAPVSPQVGQNPSAIAAGGLGGLGGPDLAVTNFNDNSVSILLNTGAGDATFLPAADTATGLFPVGVVAGDFGEPGIAADQLVVANTGEPTVTPIFFPSGTAVPAGGYPSAITAGQFDGDSDLDLAVANPSTPTGEGNQAQVLLNEGGGAFNLDPDGPFTTGSLPMAITSGALGGKGEADLAVANTNSNNVTVLLSQGQGGFTPAPGSPVGAGGEPSAIAAADLNGDGLDDLAVPNRGSGQVSIMLNDPGTCSGEPVTLAGTRGDDDLRGTKRDDVIAGFGGRDFIKGLGGDDTVCAGGGDDPVHAHGGDDLVLGQRGNDSLRGHGGRDDLRGHRGRDRLGGGAGKDRCKPGRGKDPKPRGC